MARRNSSSRSQVRSASRVVARASRVCVLGALLLSCDSGEPDFPADFSVEAPTAPTRDPSYDLEHADKKPEDAKPEPDEEPDDEPAGDEDEGDAAAEAAAAAEPIKKKKKKGGYKGGSKGKSKKIDLHYDKDPFGPDEPSPNQVQMQQEAIQYELDDISNDLDEALEKIEELEGKK
jgi:hypothetical protein